MQPTTQAAGTPGAALAAVAGTLSVPGHALRVAVGQEVAARVLAMAGGIADLAVAGGRTSARTTLPLQPGQTLRLVVSTADDERVVLRPAPTGGTGPTADTPGRSAAFGALRAAGLTAPTAGALLASLAEAGVPPPTADAATRLGARAAQAGVAGRSLATAFVRLDAAGLPTAPTAVAGLAALADGPTVGRALAAVIDAARAATPAAAPTTPPPASPASTAGAANPQAPPPATAPQVPTAAAAQHVPAPGGGPAQAHPSQPPGAAPQAGAPAHVAAALAGLVDRIARDVVSGDPAALRAAIADLGAGLEARLARGDVPRETPVRALLSTLASHTGTEPALARAAAGLADAVGAQPLAATAGGPTPTGPPAAGGAYLQLPLPGGGTVEVRIDPDAAGGPDGGTQGPRRIAFLLDLSALGPVMVMATADGGPVDARVRAADAGARSFLADNLPELATALGTDGRPALVRVEALARSTPERLIAPPPATGMERWA